MTKPTVVDLFCGAGGLSLGFQDAGFDLIASFDCEPFNIETHEKNFPDCRSVEADLSRVDGSEIRRMGGIESRQIDVLVGGPPCQGFSVGGQRRPEDERNLLVLDFARLVKELSPNYFVMENVQGILSTRSKAIMSQFLSRIRKCGYSVVEPICALNASDYGVPQRRKRTFVIGYKKGLTTPSYPAVGENVPLGVGATVVADALGDLPDIDSDDRYLGEDVFYGSLKKAKSRYASILRGICETVPGVFKSRSRSHGLTGCMRTLHSSKTVRRFSRTLPGCAEPVSRYIRLKWDGISPTLRAGTGKERGSHTAPRPIHPEYNRCITTREAARLHSYPDWFQFYGTRWHDFRQIGNSVPPFLGRAIAISVMKAIRKERRKYSLFRRNSFLNNL